MAKRKRLSPANPVFLTEDTPSPAPTRVSNTPPIADVAGDASAQAALEEVSATLTRAREEGRMVLTLPLEQIETEYLVRDRISVVDEDMVALADSLRARGQQTPVEVVPLDEGRYGLISGWRRCAALKEIGTETVLALLRQPEHSGAAYVAMVEENEIRVGLSYYERARIVARTVETGVYSSPKEALSALFASASRAKRSKIKSFISVVTALDGVLRFPQAIGERLGLQLAKALEADEASFVRFRSALIKAAPQSAEAEQAVIMRMLQSPNQSLSQPKKAKTSELLPGLSAQQSPNRLTLSGVAMTPDMQARLLDWLKAELE